MNNDCSGLNNFEKQSNNKINFSYGKNKTQRHNYEKNGQKNSSPKNILNIYKNINSYSSQKYEYLENKELINDNLNELFTISLSTFYIENFLSLNFIKKIKNNSEQEIKIFEKQEIFKMKLEINKRLNQLNNDYNMIYNISNILDQYNKNYIFIDIFVIKIIEQSLIQVSRYQESYKQYSTLFKFLYSDELFLYYKYKLFSTKTNEEGIKGIYSVYFGLILECEMLDEAWTFIAGLLNGDEQEKNYTVLETYLTILGNFLNCKIPKYFKKLLNYIIIYIVDKIEKAPLKFRIESKIKEFLT